MTSFEIDLAHLRAFATAADGLGGQVEQLHGLVAAAALAPGTFTETTGGRRIDGVHSILRDRVSALVDTVAGQIRAGVTAATDAADDYARLDLDGERTFDAVRGQVDTSEVLP